MGRHLNEPAKRIHERHLLRRMQVMSRNRGFAAMTAMQRARETATFTP
jgi:hypothetical protein